VALHLHLLHATYDELLDAWVSIGALWAGQTGNRVSDFILRTVESVVAEHFLAAVEAIAAGKQDQGARLLSLS
jgi:hypothetical protein